MIKVIGAAIIKNQEGKILAERLNKEKKSGVWVPPGGKLENNESVRECIKRELIEELNITVKVEELAGISEETYPDGDWVFILYNAMIVSGIPTIQEPDKILEIKWLNIDQLKNANNIRWIKHN